MNQLERWFWCETHLKAEREGFDTGECLLTGPFSTKNDAEEFKRNIRAVSVTPTYQPNGPDGEVAEPGLRDHYNAVIRDAYQLLGIEDDGELRWKWVRLGIHDLIATNARQAAELRRYAHWTPDHTIEEWLDETQAELREARKALEQYGRHWDICISRVVPTGCDCGLSRALTGGK